MKRFYFLLALSMLVSAFWAEVQVQRDRTYLREGAGSYHPVITFIPLGTKLELLEQDGSWLRVTFQNKTGYVSESSTLAQKPRSDVFTKISKNSPSSSGVSRHSISAGVKGFGERYNKKFKGNPKFLDYAMDKRFTFKSYPDFRKKTYAGYKAKEYSNQWTLPPRKEADFYTEEQEGFGLAVASVISDAGVIQDELVSEYINYVGHLIVENTDVSDIFFRFYILDIPQANAYACPGGFIFITRGMLKAINTEAELAFVLAHEIAHVAQFHGIAEAKSRENQIGAEKVFDDLDEEMSASFSEKGEDVAAELEEDIFAIYENLVEGRLDMYEQEADSFGLLYLARTGYDPQAAVNLLMRLNRNASASNNQHYRPESIKERLNWVSKDASRYNSRKLKYFTHTERFTSYRNYF